MNYAGIATRLDMLVLQHRQRMQHTTTYMLAVLHLTKSKLHQARRGRLPEDHEAYTKLARYLDISRAEILEALHTPVVASVPALVAVAAPPTAPTAPAIVLLPPLLPPVARCFAVIELPHCSDNPREAAVYHLVTPECLRGGMFTFSEILCRDAGSAARVNLTVTTYATPPAGSRLCPTCAAEARELWRLYNESDDTRISV